MTFPIAPQVRQIVNQCCKEHGISGLEEKCFKEGMIEVITTFAQRIQKHSTFHEGYEVGWNEAVEAAAKQANALPCQSIHYHPCRYAERIATAIRHLRQL